MSSKSKGPKYIQLNCDSDPQAKISDLYKSTETNINFGHPTKGGTPIDPKLTPLQSWRFNLINMYVTDALNTRPPNKKLEARDPEQDFKGWIPIHTAYKLSHNSFWSTFVYVSIWFHLGLILYEPYANVTLLHEGYPWVLYIIECSILLIYSIDVYLHYISHDKENYWDLSWAKVIVVCIVLNFIDVLISIIVHQFMFQDFILRFGAVLRPIFLICRSQFLRATVRSVFNAIPRVLDVLFLVCLYILMFAVFGYVLFSQDQMGIGTHVDVLGAVCDEAATEGDAYDTDCSALQQQGNVNFATIYDSYLSLCVLMSTANYPDVMMPSFHDNKYSGFFFVAFVAFGIYYLMSIIFAVIYHHYHEDNERFVRKMTENRAKALDAAFKQMVIFSKEMSNPLYELTQQKQAQLNFNEERLYFSVFRRFIQFRRKKICDRRTRVLYNAMCEARARTEAVKLHEDDGIGITREQWQNLYKFVNVEIFRDPSYAVEYMIKTGEENVMLNIILGNENMYSMDGGCCHRLFIDKNISSVGDRKGQCCYICAQKVYFSWLRFRGLLYRIFTHKWIAGFIDLLVWIGTMVLIYEISTVGYDKTLDKISDVLVVVFVVEVSLRFVAFGKYFFRDGFNILDFLVVWGSLLVDLVDAQGHWTGKITDDADHSSNGLVAFRLLRFVRALGTIDRFKMIISTSITVLSKVGVLFSLEFCVFYIFAVIGAFCYGGVVTSEAALEQLAIATDNGDVDDTGFWTYIRDNYYYDNNMNAISNTLVVMVELTVVNQWHAITRMYVELTSSWTYLYFYLFYFVSVLIVANVLTAFVFDSFIIQFQFAQTEQEELRKKKARKQKLTKLNKLKKQRQVLRQTKKNQKRKKKQLNIQSLLPVSSGNSGALINDYRQPVVVSALNGYQGVQPYDASAMNVKERMSIDEDREMDDDNDDNLVIDKESDTLISEFSRQATSFMDELDNVLDEFIDELNISDREDWHKWIAIAMLYEFDTDDVIKGVWLYDRKKTTADFYEQIYGEINKKFIEYLIKWGEIDEDHEYSDERDRADTDQSFFRSRENTAEARSQSGVANSPHADEDMMQRGPSFQSNMTLESSNTIRGRGKDIFVTRRAIKRKSIFDRDSILALKVEDDDGKINHIEIKGPKQSNIFAALSTAPQVGLAPQFNNMNKKSAGKISKLMDIYQPPSMT